MHVVGIDFSPEVCGLNGTIKQNPGDRMGGYVDCHTLEDSNATALEVI
jgi:hypothetical protein